MELPLLFLVCNDIIITNLRRLEGGSVPVTHYPFQNKNLNGKYAWGEDHEI